MNLSKHADTLTEPGALCHAPDALVARLEEDAARHDEQGAFGRASEALEVLVEMRPERPELWVMLGHALRRQRRTGPALLALRRAIELAPEDRDAMLQLGELLCEAGRPVEGLELVRAVFDMGRDPGAPPDEQDLYTIRAGAIIEGVQRGLAFLERAHRGGHL